MLYYKRCTQIPILLKLLNNNVKRAIYVFLFKFVTCNYIFLAACAHTIAISPTGTPERVEGKRIQKKVAYVMADADRAKQITTAGGGGDKVSYFPYRDLEKVIRDALRSVYADVFVIKATTDSDAIKSNDVAFIFIPEITTSSSSDSIFTWPPTKFTTEISCNVTDSNGKKVSQIKATGNGFAEFSEFKGGFGLAGRRSATDVAEKLSLEVLANKDLH